MNARALVDDGANMGLTPGQPKNWQDVERLGGLPARSWPHQPREGQRSTSRAVRDGSASPGRPVARSAPLAHIDELYVCTVPVPQFTCQGFLVRGHDNLAKGSRWASHPGQQAGYPPTIVGIKVF